MIEWLWQTLVDQRIERIAHGLRGGGFQHHDVIFILTVAGACILGIIWIVRGLGGKAAADQWDNSIRETAKLAEREGWHGVREWHRKFGYDKPPTSPDAAANSTLSYDLFLIAMAVAVGLLFWAII